VVLGIAVIDLYAPPAPGSLMRSIRLSRSGLWRLARRTCELYSVMIVSAGSWGRFQCSDAAGNSKFIQPSTFTGSFWLGGCCEGGLIVELDARDCATNLTVNWREPDARMV
jgi:hypothetical protein